MTSYENYWRRFSDDTAERWSVRSQDRAWIVSLPNHQQISIEGGEPSVGWTGPIERDSASTRLWTNSLFYLVELLSLGDVQEVTSVLHSFSKHLAANRDSDEIRSGSLDHQSALQLRTCCEVLAWCSIGEVPDQAKEAIKEICREIVKQVRYLVHKYSLLSENNHGIMLGIALLHAQCLYADCFGPEERVTTEGFLRDAFESILGPNGVANENTPIYQGFYVALLEQLIGFLAWRDGEVDRYFERKLEVARSAYRSMMLPDGSVPPLGDANLSSQSRLSARLGEWYSEADGLYVRSSRDSYLSFVSGFRGVFHKHIDDTSLFLWHRGKVIFGDGGFKSYDARDQVAVSLRGQTGHSGLYFREFDHLNAQKIVSFGAVTRLVQPRMVVHPPDAQGRRRIDGSASLKQTHVKRSITLVSDNRLMIRDEAWGNESANAVVSRFLLDANSTASFIGDAILIQNSNVWASIVPSSGVDFIEARRGVMTSDGLSYGFTAPKQYTQRKCLSLEVLHKNARPEYHSKVLFFVEFGTGKIPADKFWKGSL